MTTNQHIGCFVICGLLIPGAARAQELVEVAGGYTVVDYKTSTLAQPVGWFASLVARPGDYFAVATEFSAEFDTDETLTRPVRRRAYTFLSGPRGILDLPMRTSLFGEILLGIAHDRDFLPDRSSANRFVWQPGAGVDFRLSQRVAVRFQIGARYDEWGKFGDPIASRFVSGLVVSTSPNAQQRATDAVLDSRLAAEHAKVRKAEEDARFADEDARSLMTIARRAAASERQATEALHNAQAAADGANARVDQLTKEKVAPATLENAQKEAARLNAELAAATSVRAAAKNAADAARMLAEQRRTEAAEKKAAAAKARTEAAATKARVEAAPY